VWCRTKKKGPQNFGTERRGGNHKKKKRNQDGGTGPLKSRKNQAIINCALLTRYMPTAKKRSGSTKNGSGTACDSTRMGHDKRLRQYRKREKSSQNGEISLTETGLKGGQSKANFLRASGFQRRRPRLGGSRKSKHESRWSITDFKKGEKNFIAQKEKGQKT